MVLKVDNKFTNKKLIAKREPKQKLLINKYNEKAKKGIIIGVGGTFDVLSR